MKVYHTTKKEFINSILEKGLKINSSFNKTLGAQDYVKDIYGVNPIYVSLKPGKFINGVILEIEVTEDLLVADIPSLVDHSGQFSDGYKTIWWDEYIDDPKADLIYDLVNENGEVETSKLITPQAKETNLAIQITGTAAILSDIPSKDIKVFGNIDKKGALSNLKESIKELSSLLT